jgi:hypothetical protein
MTSTRTRRTALAAGIAAVALAGATGLASTALFTATDSSTGNTFATGTVDIATGGGASVFTLSNLAPRSVNYAVIDVENTGSLEHRYAMDATTSGTNGLDGQLDIKIAAIAAGATCDAAAVSSTIYDGKLDEAFFGDVAAGSDSGDRVLAAADEERLCLEVTMPDDGEATDNAFQGSSASATFDFKAEQTFENS